MRGVERVKTGVAIALAGAIVFAVSPVNAQPVNRFSGVWTSYAGACPLMRKVGTRAIFMSDEDFAIVTLGQGLIINEFFCDFDRIAYDGEGKSAIIRASCGDPGYSFEDVIYLDWMDEAGAGGQDRFEFNSSLITGETHPGKGDEESRFIFTRCDDLTEKMLAERSEP